MKKRLSWEPVRRGPIYCAPACGRGCTRAEFDGARRGAALLAKRMGRGWTARVWENLGWHFEALSPCGRVKVSPLGFSCSGYHAFVGKPGGPGVRWFAYGRTPKTAVARAIANAKAELAEVGAEIVGL